MYFYQQSYFMLAFILNYDNASDTELILIQRKSLSIGRLPMVKCTKQTCPALDMLGHDLIGPIWNNGCES